MPSQSEIAAYLRVSSLAIALFDFVSTIPGELRLYSHQSSFKHLSPACIFFILVRYISIAALVTSNVGFFAEGFTLVACRHFYLIAPVLKLMATLVSQVIIGVRTYAIARKSRWVVWALGILFVITLVPEIMGNVVRRVVVQKHGSCTSGNLHGAKLAWLHYLAAMIFDAVAMGIASYYLILSSRGMKYPMVTDLSRMMLQEGIVYFLALTAFNILNLVLFRGDNFEMQSAATTLGQAVTMIFSQKLILSLSDGTFEQLQLREREYSTSSGFLPESRIMLHPSVPPSPLSLDFNSTTYSSPGYYTPHPRPRPARIRVEKGEISLPIHSPGKAQPTFQIMNPDNIFLNRSSESGEC